MFENPDFSEVFRSLDIEIRVLETNHDENHPSRPRIHFAGTMGDQSTMNGWVQMTPDDQIRWHFVRAIRLSSQCRFIIFTQTQQVSGEQGMAIWRFAL
jgi:hypothetical protein